MSDAPCVIVTGASRGIGRSVALRLARDGYAVAGCYRSGCERAEETARQVEALGARTLFARCDVQVSAVVEEFIRTAERELGPITALVNNAGIVRDSPLVRMSEEQWRDVIDTNLTGTWNLCRAAVFRFLKRRAGAVVNLSSVAGVYGNAGQTNYAASKAGIIGFSKSLAKEVAAYGVRVNVVAPGFIETEMTTGLSEELRNHALSRIPLRRFGTADDVADTVSYLLSERAAYITGQVLQVDGGIAL